MKIPFDIKYRPQIESGEYKVETRDGRRTRIICWDAIGQSPIIGLFLTDDGGETTTQNRPDGRWCDDLNYESDYDLFLITPEPELSEFEVKMKEIRSLYVAMQEQGVDDRYGDALSANLPGMIKWLTDKIELAKREREFSNAVHTDSEELTPFENCVLKMIDDIVKCITYPNDSCIPNVRTVAAELLALARDQFIKDGYVIEKKAFHDAVEKIDDKNKAEMSIQYSLHCKVENGTRHAVMNWEAFQKVAQKFIDIGKAEALKDLPRWRKWGNGAAGNSDGHPIALVSGAGGIRFVSVLGTTGEKYIMLADLKELPGFNEDEK